MGGGQARATASARCLAGCFGVPVAIGDRAVNRVLIRDQTANQTTPRYRTGGIGLADVATVLTPDQTANLITPRHRTGGIGLADAAIKLMPDQTANLVRPRHRSGGIGLANTTISEAVTDQTTNAVLPVH